MGSSSSNVRFLKVILAYLGFFRAPVIDKFGHSYEKSYIIQWVNDRQKSPLANEPITLNDLRLNKNVADLVKFLVLRHRFNLKDENRNNRISLKELI